MTRTWLIKEALIKFLLISLIVLLNSSFVWANENSNDSHHIVVLKSKDNVYYNQAIHAFSNVFASNLQFNVFNINHVTTSKTPKIIIALGTEAAHYSRQHYPEAKKIIAFITLQQSLNLQILDNESHLLIEQQSQDYLNFAQLLLPNFKMGVLFLGTKNKQLNQLQKTAIETRFFEVENESRIINATRKTIKSTDALVALPNKKIYNRHTLKGILLSTFQNGKPLISYSAAHVKAGAMAALYASTSNIGQHIADQTKIALKQKQLDQTRLFAKYFSIKINQRVAKSLGISLPDTLQLQESVRLKRLDNG